MSKQTVLRIGVYNNFNFTEAESKEVAKLKGFLPFVNSNSFVTIKADYPSIITINPYLDSWQPPVGDISNVKACRVKWVAAAKPRVYEAQTEAIRWCLEHSIPVLITFMRFISRCSMASFVTASGLNRYHYNHSYYRLFNASGEFAEICKLAGNRSSLIYACDLDGTGCPDCGNCARLTYGLEPDEADIASLSLSCSGDSGKCLFHCPDCWAKRLAKIANFKLDSITVNNKQKGN